uniref:Autophagy-related protein 101 n=2 Tax=Serinus canaria TaxID=9135 RepID=A0A8C9NJT6_SERCA
MIHFPPCRQMVGPGRSRCCGPSSAGAAMNCRAEVLEVSVEGRQVEEAMLAVLHTVLLHRSTGKFHYKKEGTYSIGTVGTQDVDCDFIDFAYVRVSSEELDRALRKAVGEFKDALRSSGSDGMGQISLEFYQKKKSRWPFSDECIPWELWTIKVNVVNLANEQERQICREKVGEKLCEKIINIVEVMNRHEYLPKMPTQSEGAWMSLGAGGTCLSLEDGRTDGWMDGWIYGWMDGTDTAGQQHLCPQHLRGSPRTEQGAHVGGLKGPRSAAALGGLRPGRIPPWAWQCW